MFSSLGGLWHWITENATVFSGLTSVGMLLIWAIYLQLMLHNFRMQRRPQIIINRGKGRDINSVCLFSNMSQQSVFIDLVMARIKTSDTQWYCDVTDIVDEAGKAVNIASNEDGTDVGLHDFTRQGPMKPGDYLDAGTFGNMSRQVGLSQGLELNEHHDIAGESKLISIEISLIATFGAEKHPIGARRAFHMERAEDGRILLSPETTHTEQFKTRRQRRTLRRWRRELGQL